MNVLSSIADGDADLCRADTTERLDAAIAQSRELREEMRLSIARLRLVLTLYQESVHDFSRL